MNGAPARRPAADVAHAVVKGLRRPAVIVAEVTAIALVGVLAVLVPQQPDGAAVRAFAARWPALSRVTAATGLHDVTTAGWFVALVVAALASLLLVQAAQWKRVVRLWRQRPCIDAMARAAYRRAAPASTCRRVPDAPRLEVKGRLGLLGSPTFHLGLVLVLCAGVSRLLLFSEADARLVEGEVLDASPDAWVGQRKGPLARPFSLEGPIRLERVSPDWYPSRNLRGLEAVVASGLGGKPRRLAINAPLDLGRERLYLTSQWGVGVLLEHRTPSSSGLSTAYLEIADERARGTLALSGGREARLKMEAGPEGASRMLEVRLVRDRVLAGVGAIAQGEEMVVGPGESLKFVDLRYWAIVRGSRDPSRPLFFIGIAVAITGAVLIFAVVRVETAVFVERDMVVVALRSQRFAPLFSERFEALCKEWIG